MKRLLRILSIIIILTILLVACQPKKIKVAYTVYPIQYLLEEIGGDKVELLAFSDNNNVMRAQLADDYKEVLKNVDTIFTIGGLEPYLDIINQEMIDYKPNIYDLGSKGAVVQFGRYTKVIVDNVEVGVETSYYENPVFENIDTYTNDPFIWLDPIMMTSMSNEVLAYLVEQDPDNTDFYTKNFEKVKMNLAFLDAKYAEVKSKSNIRMASMIPAFGAYANNYGLSVSPIMLSKYGNLPTTAQLEVIKVRLINDNVKYLIIEEDLDEDILKLADDLSNELNLTKVNISSLSSRSKLQEENKLDYIDIMNENLNTLNSLEEITE